MNISSRQYEIPCYALRQRCSCVRIARPEWVFEKWFLFAYFLLLYNMGGATAQTTRNHGPHASINVYSVYKSSSARHAHRFHKRLPANFSGYVIEIAAANYPLPRDFSVFGQFGNVYYDKVKRGGFSYLIIPQMRTRKEIERFFVTVIKPRLPESRLIRYKRGMRKL